MESIKKYFRSLLIGLATLILANTNPPTQINNKESEPMEDEADYHMFI